MQSSCWCHLHAALRHEKEWFNSPYSSWPALLGPQPLTLGRTGPSNAWCVIGQQGQTWQSSPQIITLLTSQQPRNPSLHPEGTMWAEACGACLWTANLHAHTKLFSEFSPQLLPVGWRKYFISGWHTHLLLSGWCSEKTGKKENRVKKRGGMEHKVGSVFGITGIALALKWVESN